MLLKKIFVPALVHLCLCLINYLIFTLTWMGPEGGILLNYAPIGTIPVFVLSCLIQIVVIVIYFFVGVKMAYYPKEATIGICSTIVINIAIIVIFYINDHEISAAVENFAIYGGSPFFLLNLLSDMNIAVGTAEIFMPSVIMAIGSRYGRRRV